MEPVGIDSIMPVDLVVVGSVAVSPKGYFISPYISQNFLVACHCLMYLLTLGNYGPPLNTYYYWRHGVVVSGVRRMNEVNAHRARLVPGWMTIFGRVYHLCV